MGKALTATPSRRCTTGCTSEAENANADPLDGDRATLADDTLDGIVNALRKLPEDRQAEIVRRLGEPRPDADLARILRAWPNLPATVRAGVATAAEGFAAANAGEQQDRTADRPKPKGRSKAKGTTKGR